MEKDEPIHWLSHSLLSSYLPYILPNAGHFQWLNPPLEAGKLGILQHETMYQSDLDVRLAKGFFFQTLLSDCRHCQYKQLPVSESVYKF